MEEGFTLIELLVVVAIIGVLATIILGSLNNARASARDAKRLSDIKTIQTALEIYYLDNGEYPPTSLRLSHSWASLENLMGVNLPKDPIDESQYPYSGGHSYGYYSGPAYAGCAPGTWYLLVYNLE